MGLPARLHQAPGGHCAPLACVSLWLIRHPQGAPTARIVGDVVEGVVSAIVAAVVGGLVSLFVSKRAAQQSRRDNEDLAREEASLIAARDLSTALVKLTRQLADLRALPDRQGYRLLKDVAESFEEQLLTHAPALHHVTLRDAVEEVPGVLLNFAHAALKARWIPGDWNRGDLRIAADIQRSDYIYLVGEALRAYRQGDTVELPAEPGWRRIRGQVAWAVPPGVYVDGSGDPAPHWEQRHDGGWVQRSE